ncbi:MAG TPA: hypothetical protein VL576_00780 [Candidatus Paceibacterota bacterium]|jgi:hypothetical protein|nr:hypothetical protein [Candidatus Paceibacterota bacterium]
MGPSKELEAAAENTVAYSQESLIKWLLVFQKIGVDAGFTSSQIVRRSKENTSFDLDIDNDTIFNIHSDITPEADTTVFVVINFKDKNVAEIGKEVYNFDNESGAPEDLLQKISPTLGFKGTWEEVTRKWIELKAIVAANSNIPPVPDDL